MDINQVVLLFLVAAFPLSTFGPLWSSFRSFIEDGHISAGRFLPIALSFILISLSYAGLLFWPFPLRCSTGMEISYEQVLLRVVAPMIGIAIILGTVGARDCFHIPRLTGCGKNHGRPFSPSTLISSDILLTVDLKRRWTRHLMATSVVLIVCWGVRELIAGIPI
jgi:hypothetical protein